tara:strand:- start:106 stop:309 length:204 start_codon:yes stop_codon:yes gene_type:complete
MILLSAAGRGLRSARLSQPQHTWTPHGRFPTGGLALDGGMGGCKRRIRRLRKRHTEMCISLSGIASF